MFPAVVSAALAVSALSAPAAAAQEPAPAACPANLEDSATCYTGLSADGAYYAIAVPEKWNGSLVVHAHGGRLPSVGIAP
ncbi:hypothetical protein [Streptomyces sp. AK010]|uniref:hypothetical protein n=1 Tax=Streptomyces sp. AK010 TaxID=2723074 RepID=UPI001608313D|nr:hypothetical protein [Streptomyces sp. AK010]MBB6417498.1 hypothetical protein [Streptomyces sp. AK010]